MISIYVVLSGLFATLAVISYHFSVDSLQVYKSHAPGLRKEHRLYHLIFSTLLCVSTSMLAVLYFTSVLFSTVFIAFSSLVPALLYFTHGMMIIFVCTCMLFLKHVSDEEKPHNRLYRDNSKHATTHGAVHRESD